MDTLEIKKCYCGSEARFRWDSCGAQIVCRKCEMAGPIRNTETGQHFNNESATLAWNEIQENLIKGKAS
jgi:hypothetical protein